MVTALATAVSGPKVVIGDTGAKAPPAEPPGHSVWSGRRVFAEEYSAPARGESRGKG
jgi:hypothetical protein